MTISNATIERLAVRGLIENGLARRRRGADNRLGPRASPDAHQDDYLVTIFLAEQRERCCRLCLKCSRR